MVAVVEIQLGAGNVRGADVQCHYILVEFADAALAAIGLKLLDQNSQGAAGVAGRAARAKYAAAEAPPTMFQTHQVFRGTELAEEFIFQSPSLIGQVAARARRSQKMNNGLHASIVRRRLLLAESDNRLQELGLLLKHRQVSAIGNELNLGLRNLLVISLPISGRNQAVVGPPDKQNGT